MPTCPYCIHIWIDFNVDMYIPTVLLKPSYMYYSYMCNPHVNLPLNSKWSWLKPHLVNSGRDPALYVCMCVYILYIHEWLGNDVGPGPGPGLWFEDLTSDQSVQCLDYPTLPAVLSSSMMCTLNATSFSHFHQNYGSENSAMRCLSGFSLRCFIKSLWRWRWFI